MAMVQEIEAQFGPSGNSRVKTFKANSFREGSPLMSGNASLWSASSQSMTLACAIRP
jgi:hypothetical protein